MNNKLVRYACLLGALCVVNGITDIALGQVVFKELKSFGFPERSGTSAEGSLIEGNDGKLYGTTTAGGIAGAGTIFRVSKDGQDYKVIKHFAGNSTNSDGAIPRGGLIQAGDGMLYGTTYVGGMSNNGTVFRINSDGSGFLILKSFPGGSEGANPIGTLVQANDGRLYGTTYVGGASNCGTVFGLNTDGSGFAVLKSYSGSASEGGYPVGNLIQGTNGALFGVTGYITNNLGTVFSVNPDGSGYGVLKIFSSAATDGSSPLGGLVQATNGILYGTTSKGGSGGAGLIFKLKSDGSGYSVLQSFSHSGTSSQEPRAGLTQGTDGALYGVSMYGGASGYGTVFKINLDGSGFNVVKSFANSGIGDPQGPFSRLLMASDGFLYGTTERRSLAYGTSSWDGALYRIHPDGTEYGAVWLFLSTGGDGQSLFAGPIVATNGVLYGTTYSGGTHSYGTVYRMNWDGGSYAVLKTFGESASDGIEPQSPLIQANNGMLYGTCTFSRGFGTVFRMDLDGNEYTNVHTFANSAGEGLVPHGGLVQASDGMLYGTTYQGGAYGQGTVFRMDLDGGSYSVIWSFAGTNGTWPETKLVEGENGFLYGTTSRGGTFGNGTVFKVKRDGTDFSSLHSFNYNGYDGAIPLSSVSLRNGVVYGSTPYGGDQGSGTLFRVNVDGTDYRVIRSFAGWDGAVPCAVAVGSNDVIYGMTYGGGGYGNGTVFQINLDGTGYGLLKSFPTPVGSYYSPYGGIMLSADGLLYGTTFDGGTMGGGTIFSLDPAVSILTTLPGTIAGSMQIKLKGVTGRIYSLQRASSLGGPWNAITSLTTDLKGDASFMDNNAPANGAFYRTVYP